MAAIAGRFSTHRSGSVGAIAQLVERVVRNDEAWGSNPHTSTNFASANSGDFWTLTRRQRTTRLWIPCQKSLEKGRYGNYKNGL